MANVKKINNAESIEITNNTAVWALGVCNRFDGFKISIKRLEFLVENVSTDSFEHAKEDSRELIREYYIDLQ